MYKKIPLLEVDKCCICSEQIYEFARCQSQMLQSQENDANARTRISVVAWRANCRSVILVFFLVVFGIVTILAVLIAVLIFFHFVVVVCVHVVICVILLLLLGFVVCGNEARRFMQLDYMQH